MMKFLHDHKDGSRLQKIEIDKSVKGREPTIAPLDYTGSAKGITAFLALETDIGRGRGIVRLCRDPADGEWKAFTLFATLEELKGHEEPLGPRRADGVAHGANPGRKNWFERREAERNYSDGLQPTVVIVGTYGRCLERNTTDNGRCRSSRSLSRCTSQNAWCRHTAHPQQQASGRQLA